MDENTTPSSAPQASGSNKNMLLIGLFVVIALGVLGAVFFMGQSRNNNQEAAQTASVSPTPDGVGVEVTEETVPADGSTTPTTVEGAMTAGKEKTFTVEASAFKFSPATITVNEGDTVKIVVNNKGGTHDLVIDEFDVATKQLASGQSETVEFVANKAGTYEFYCSVGNHREMGMVGKLIVK